MFEQPFVPLLFGLLLVSSDGFLFAVVLYLLADVYLDASPPPPYLGGSSKPFWGGGQRCNFQLQNIQERATHQDLEPDPV